MLMAEQTPDCLHLPPGLTLDSIDAELGRRRYVHDPVGWIRERLKEHVWSKQAAIAESVRDHRRTAVQSCHEAGKSFIAARISAWWLETAGEVGEAFVVTSAPTFKQVRNILWREINRAHARGGLKGRVNQTEWWMPFIGADGTPSQEIVAFGQKPADMDPDAFQGIHARRVLVIFDEACGIPKALWEAADSLIANDESRIFAIGNPDNPASEFAEVCKPGSGWNVIRISAFDTPNFTGEAIPDKLKPLLIGQTWVEEKRRKWGEQNPLWKAKVEGLFPEVSQDGLIPIAWVKAAQERELAAGEPVQLGMDVGGGGDKTTIYVRRGPVVRLVRKDNEPDTMKTTGHLLQALTETGASEAKVDCIGIGAGVTHRARELRKPVQGVNVGESAQDKERFANRRAELCWALRERFQDGDIDLDPDDDDLAAQCCAIQFKPNSRGQIVIESKDDYKKRLKTHSPDEFDAVMLAFAKLAVPTQPRIRSL